MSQFYSKNKRSRNLIGRKKENLLESFFDRISFSPVAFSYENYETGHVISSLAPFCIFGRVVLFLCVKARHKNKKK